MKCWTHCECRVTSLDALAGRARASAVRGWRAAHRRVAGRSRLGAAEPVIPNFSPLEIEQMLQQRQELMRYLAYLVELVGGEIRIPPDVLMVDRVLQKDMIGLTGVVRLTTEKP